MTSLLPQFLAYFGRSPGGVDLRRSILDLPLPQMQTFCDAVKSRGPGRLFFMGNGGSYDNARLMARCCRVRGIHAKTPGDPDDYLPTALASSYTNIYKNGLQLDELTPRDIVVGISGSGNSENILAALAYAKDRGATIFCMGGRDGGQMLPTCGAANSMIARNQCMEAIEDLHMVALLVVLDALQHNGPVTSSLERFLQHFDAFATDKNLAALAEIGQAMLETIPRHGHMFILGTGIGANHFRADMGRGATNALPIRGISAPECFTMNSAQATANDDGLHFVLVDGLVKHSPSKHDFAILCELPGSQPLVAHCRELLDATGTPNRTVGLSGVNLQMFETFDYDFAISMLGHACGAVIRAQLQTQWTVRDIPVPPAFALGQKKHGIRDTQQLENRLRLERTLAEDELLTFCYGRLFAVRPPKDMAHPRCYF